MHRSLPFVLGMLNGRDQQIDGSQPAVAVLSDAETQAAPARVSVAICVQVHILLVQTYGSEQASCYSVLAERPIYGGGVSDFAVRCQEFAFVSCLLLLLSIV